MIIVAGHLDYADSAARGSVLEAGKALQQATRNEEPGCIAYAFSADPTHDGRIRVFELWADTESLAAHFEHANYHDMREVFHMHPRSGGEVRKYRCAPSEPMYDEAGNIRADFITA